ncbi:nucleoside hydrolase [Roseibium algae]|uniref:Nucleoside hydrolase n=1 Tax=Roseibium algae TaxID=3123038 RepID=A0ABU8TF73_9HYPH
MSALWVDTDFGFDDLWAVLLLRQLGAKVAGISLVAGNAPLPQVTSNALGARSAYGIDAPVYSGADHPLVRMQETAERILGPFGMQSRGRRLPEPKEPHSLPDALPALAKWLDSGAPGEPREVLALGPLTNIANLTRRAPQSAAKISRLVWMGGSAGPGNHSAMAEFNALADPEAAAVISAARLPLDVVDLMLCRKITFGPSDVPVMPPLMADLIGGYLDIGLSRGRPGMAIYDPVAALAAMRPDLFQFEKCRMQVSITPDDSYGATAFHSASEGETRLATDVTPDMAHICLTALAEEVANER